MFEAVSNAGPERAPKKNADIVFGNPHLWGTQTVHPPKIKVAHRREPQKKKITCVHPHKNNKKNAHGREFHIAGASMFDLGSNVS